MDQRGSSLATTLVFSSLALLLALALSSTSISHLHFSNSHKRALRAQAAAESTIALALERLLKDPEFGQDQQAVVELDFEDSFGRLSFSPSRAQDWDLPYSTNNRNRQETATGSLGATIPPESVQLFAQGTCNGMTRNLEVVVRVPDFPYAIASAGPIHSQGSLLVGALSQLEDAFPSINREDLEEAHLASNASGEAITIANDAEITGNIQAVGEIVLGDGVDIQGELRPGSEAVRISRVDLEAIRPEDSSPVQEFQSATIRGSRHVNSAHTEFSRGLTMDDGILFVSGDLVVRGGLQGRGAIIADGSITIHDGAALSADNEFALVATDSVTVDGVDRDSSFFQGLIYTEGDLVARDVTLLGSFVANRPATPTDPGSRISLHNAGVVHLPGYGEFETESRLLEFTFPHTGRAADPEHITRATYSLDINEAKYEEFKDLREDRRSRSAWRIAIWLAENRLRYDHEQNPLIPGGGTSTFSPTDAEEETETGNLLSAIGNAIIFGVNETPPPGPAPTFQELEPSFKFDLNEFIDELSRTEVVLWREF